MEHDIVDGLSLTASIDDVRRNVGADYDKSGLGASRRLIPSHVHEVVCYIVQVFTANLIYPPMLPKIETNCRLTKKEPTAIAVFCLLTDRLHTVNHQHQFARTFLSGQVLTTAAGGGH